MQVTWECCRGVHCFPRWRAVGVPHTLDQSPLTRQLSFCLGCYGTCLLIWCFNSETLKHEEEGLTAQI